MGCLQFLLSASLILCTSKTAVTAMGQFEVTIRRESTSIVDRIIEAYKHRVIASGNTKGEIKVDDIHFMETLPIIGSQANVYARDGILRNVLTIHRKESVEVEYIGFRRIVVLKSLLGMDTIHINYKQFKVDLPLIHQEATIEVEVRDPVIYTELIIQEYPCKAYIREMKIKSLGEIVPHIEGMKWQGMDKIFERIVKRFLNKVATSSRALLAKYFYKQVQEAVDFINICGSYSL